MTAGGWFARPLPDGDDPVVFCLPYTGMGASSYQEWPACIERLALVPLQPPGRESRFREGAHQTHAAFAEDLAAAMLPHVRRPYAFAAHCGGVPYALAAAFRLRGAGVPPARLIASSWGAPQSGLYGRLNHMDLDDLDPVAEVTALAERMGRTLPPDLAELVGEVLLEDLRIQRGYRYPPGEKLPCPVTVVGWSDDDVVPDARVHPGWDECGEVRHRTLLGGHRDYLRCPLGLRQLLVDELGA